LILFEAFSEELFGGNRHLVGADFGTGW